MLVASFKSKLQTYLEITILTFFGLLRELFTSRKSDHGYAPLRESKESFKRRFMSRFIDCFFRLSTGLPSRTVSVYSIGKEGKTKSLLNLGSFNYLGFAECQGFCADSVEESLKKGSLGFAGPAAEIGYSKKQSELEEAISEFVGKDSAIVFSVGFATNATSIPGLADKNTLILSDELNHASLVFGSRLSKATIKVFKHNDMRDLERLVRLSIAKGTTEVTTQGMNQRWSKIIVIVEGLYSMEGTFSNLKAIIALKQKYHFYLFIDEAHSIGAVGPRGRGVCDLQGIDPSQVDCIMGTFSKSFGSSGGFIAGSKDTIKHLRCSIGAVYSEPLSLACCSHALSAIKQSVISNIRAQAVQEHSIYFISRLKEMGFKVSGDAQSPIVSIILSNFSEIMAFSRESLKRGLAVAVVSYPATPITLPRARFCLSAAHTRRDLDYALEQISEIGDLMNVKYR